MCDHENSFKVTMLNHVVGKFQPISVNYKLHFIKKHKSKSYTEFIDKCH